VEEKKLCPFRCANPWTQFCVTDKCAIWDEDSHRCSLRSTARNTDIVIQCVERLERDKGGSINGG